MIPYHFDDAAVGDRAVGAAFDHADEFDLQRLQRRDPCFDVRQPRAGDGVGLGAGAVGGVLEREEGADRLDLEAEFASMADECKAFQVGRSVDPALALGARRGEKADLLPVADGRDLHPAAVGGFADRHV